MRKISLLTIAIVASLLTTAATASAADRYAYPDGNNANLLTCGFGENCDLESAMNTTLVTDDSKVIVAPGDYTVATALAIYAAGATLKGGGETAADVVITSTVTTDPALTLDNGTEAEKFTLNTVTEASDEGGLDVIDGVVNHIAVTATGQNATACTGRDARFANMLCHATGEFGSAFKSISGPALTLDFINSTLVPGEYGWGFAGATIGASNLLTLDLFSTIVVQGLGHYFQLGNSGGAPAPDFNAEYSNYPCTQRIIENVNGGCDAPVGATNQAEAPIFKDAVNGDFTPAATSPTVDAGSVTGLSGDTDLAGNAREQGAAADIGAFESTPPVVVVPPVILPAVVNPPVLDLLKPTITVSKKPKSKTTSKKLSVTFKASETATYQCKLDSAKFKACKSPYKKTVKVGKHKLQIKATDLAGNVSPTKTINWTVKKK